MVYLLATRRCCFLTGSPRSTVVSTQVAVSEYLQRGVARHSKLPTEVAVRWTVHLSQGDGWIVLLQFSGCYLVLRSQSLAVTTPRFDNGPSINPLPGIHERALNAPWSIELNQHCRLVCHTIRESIFIQFCDIRVFFSQHCHTDCSKKEEHPTRHCPPGNLTRMLHKIQPRRSQLKLEILPAKTTMTRVCTTSLVGPISALHDKSNESN